MIGLIMIKDYLIWTLFKKRIHNEILVRPMFREGEIWWCSLGENVGFEQDGKGSRFLRPVVILRKFSKEICWIIPLTTAHKFGEYYFHFSLNGLSNKAILSQVRLIDSKRFNHFLGRMQKDDFINMKKRFKDLIP